MMYALFILAFAMPPSGIGLKLKATYIELGGSFCKKHAVTQPRLATLDTKNQIQNPNDQSSPKIQITKIYRNNLVIGYLSLN
ncbi:MAG: hypothetical protein A3E37_02615 [Candidatus Andersenbacteria bacterium RIFCSPHIGHO2_12_FULL_46_9]|nr:MAG: hypothetical protein A3E37_02615 [Candidatus Andersenbacteria bacterium RIFCSPHIGHO2_12_FULL_46_9]